MAKADVRASHGSRRTYGHQARREPDVTGHRRRTGAFQTMEQERDMTTLRRSGSPLTL